MVYISTKYYCKLVLEFFNVKDGKVKERNYSVIKLVHSKRWFYKKISNWFKNGISAIVFLENNKKR